MNENAELPLTEAEILQQRNQLLQQQLLADRNLPNIYSNGIGLGIGSIDGIIFLARNSVPVAIINMPHETMRELHKLLGDELDKFKTQTANAAS